MAHDYDFQIWQGGMMVARVMGSNIDQVRSEVYHYVDQYIRDGRVNVKGENIGDLAFTNNVGEVTR